MNLSDPLVLQRDVVLVPVTELSAELRAKFESDEGDYALSRRHGRMGSQVIDSETAALLQLFREPRTIVDAVIENSRALAKNPEQWLDELLPHLGTFLRNRVLVPAGSDEDHEIRQLIENGATVGQWTIVRCVHLIEDSEIYVVTNDGIRAAMKIARKSVPPWFANEQSVLRHLEGGSSGSSEFLGVPRGGSDGSPRGTPRNPRNPEELTSIAPRLLDSGTHDGRPFLVIEWCDGAEPSVVSSQIRNDRVALLEVCVAIARAYAELHERQVIHADVHPRNVLVANVREAKLIDFGLSRIDGSDAPLMPRGGMYYFFEPEFLAASREGRMLPASYAGEQYAIAALLYLILTGQHYLDFRAERDEMIRQTLEETPLSFESRGLPPWSEVERILFRALSKNPDERWPSMREMANALETAHDFAAREALEAPLSEEALRFVDDELARFARDGSLFADGYTEAPKASINYGAAGAALGILRIAEVRSDPKLLALAEVWRTRAALFLGHEAGWYNEAMELQERTLGRITPYHTPAGLHAAAALIAHARGDLHTQRMACHAFLDASSLPCRELDLTLGKSGSLLTAAILLEASDGVPSEELKAFGQTTIIDIWAELDARPPLREGPPETYLGIAHGWSGYLYAALRWCVASGAPIPESIPRRLVQLAALHVPRGRGLFWPRQIGGHAHDRMAGWCNGAAGHVFLWTLAHEVFGNRQHLALAEGAAWNAYEEPRFSADLCCGTAGRAYALLNLYKHTGDAAWLSRARHLANHAADVARKEPARAHALWKGELGVAVLLADLEAPQHAAMPLFE
ncbi:MAG TPA: lanthionine synthetase LanC family protein [Thermoanaerobaculia bacterium]|jgi:serine/threonine-protein kinase